MSLPSTSPRMRFGPFELDPCSGQLRKAGTLIRLQPQPFRLLQLLAERAGRVVSREEIRLHLWAHSTFVDFEHGINFSINQIRAALSDNAERPRFIETLPRRGYRFLAPVEPGNLFLLGYRDDVPVVSAPGCFRSAKPNIVDLMLPPMLARYRVSGWEVACLGHGGLLA